MNLVLRRIDIVGVVTRFYDYNKLVFLRIVILDWAAFPMQQDATFLSF